MRPDATIIFYIQILYINEIQIFHISSFRMLTQRCYRHITLGLCRPLREELVLDTNFMSKTPLKIQILNKFVVRNFPEYESGFLTGLFERILILRGSCHSALFISTREMFFLPKIPSPPQRDVPFENFFQIPAPDEVPLPQTPSGN